VTITANIELNSDTPQGVVFANGGLTGGTALFFKDNTLYYLLNDGVNETTITSAKTLSKGKHAIRIEFAAENVVTLSIDGQQAAKQTVKKVGKSIGSIAGDGVSVGKDLNSPVTKRYTGTNPFNGAGERRW